jgi:hypothetical protein
MDTVAMVEGAVLRMPPFFNLYLPRFQCFFNAFDAEEVPKAIDRASENRDSRSFTTEGQPPSRREGEFQSRRVWLTGSVR